MMTGGSLTRRVVSPLQFLMLIQLDQEPKYGYEMLKSLRAEFDGVWELKTGTFYPALRRLEARGFVETEMQDEKEFYNLTERGSELLEQLSSCMMQDYTFIDRYFTTIIKNMPSAFKDRLFELIKSMSQQGLNVYSNLPFFLARMDREKKLETLEHIRNLLRTHLETVDDLYQSIVDGGMG